MPLPIPIPPHGTPFIDPKTGQVHLLWQNYLLALEQSVIINAAPIDAEYWLSRSNAPLTNERNIGALATGYLKITTALGVATPSSVSAVPVADLSGIVGVSQGGTGANLAATGGAAQVVQQAAAGGAFSVGLLTTASISNIAASTYTPTLTGVANVAASTAYASPYLRVGATVIVGGQVDIDPTAVATLTQLGISLPVASNFANPNEAGGTGQSSGAGVTAQLSADAANNRLTLDFTTGAVVTNQAWYWTAIYQVI